MGFADFALASLMKHNRTLKNMEKLDKANNWSRVDDILKYMRIKDMVANLTATFWLSTTSLTVSCEKIQPLPNSPIMKKSEINKYLPR